MTIPLDSAEGFFTRLGKIGLAHNTILAHVGDGANMIGPLVDDIAAIYQSTDQDVVAGSSGLYSALSSYRSSPQSFWGYLQSLAQTTIIEMADADVPLNQRTVTAALTILIQQMLAATETLNRPTTSLGSATAGSLNVGDGTLVGSIAANDGGFQPYLFDETVRFVCTQDVATGASKWSEVFTATTPAQAASNLAWDWPQGSGVSGSITSVNPQLDGTGGNLLTNSDFNTFTVANTPDSWTITVGSPGTDILSGGSGAAYAGSNCLQFQQAAGSPLTEIRQTVTLQPLTAYTFSCLMKKSAGLTGAGAIRLALIDASNGTVLTDPQGNACSATFTLSGFTTSYVRKNLTTWTPRVMPTTAAMQIKITTAIADAGEDVFVDWGALNPMTRLYSPGGPYFSLFSGATQWNLDDIITIAVNNAYDGLLVHYADRIFGLRALGLVIPTSGTPTVADSLIQ